MTLAHWDYELPPDRIAQHAMEPRDASRLLVLDPVRGTLAHHVFRELPDLLAPADLVVLNDTRVRPARLAARRATGGRMEVLLVERRGPGLWLALLARPPAPGVPFEAAGGLHARIESVQDGAWLVRFEEGDAAVEQAMERHGTVPLPPYIRREQEEAHDRERYQTVYARVPGAAAAPTAGLHLTAEVLARLAARGIAITSITLHVGLGTFLPLRDDDLDRARLHDEPYAISSRAAEAIAAARARGGRVVAVGTTVVRTLEGAARDDGGVEAGEGRSSLFIRPGHRFRVVDALVTNFHLPRSSLLLLVGAFAGRERVLEAYRAAIDAGYRFYSYGDAMLITSRAA